MNNMKQYQHWRLETDDNQVLWAYFDKKNSSVNTLDFEVMNELSNIIDLVNADKATKALVIASAKSSGFIAGADISQFTKFKDIEHATNMLKLGQDILNRLEALKIPTLALINGFCLGGGLELALACRYRIAEDSPKTRLGLPEVRLGIHPGWGGSVRLPRLIGGFEGMQLVMKGSTVSAKAAAKLGFVDAAVPKRQLMHAVNYYLKKLPAPHQATYLQSLTNMKWMRQTLGYLMRSKAMKATNPLHYPAPFHVLDNWELLGVEGQAAYDREAKSCGKLFFSDTCQNLVRVFFLQEQLKSLAKESKFKAQHVHVIGAGTMGGDIAAWCALRGMTVTLQDLEPRFIAPAIKRASKLFKEKLKDSNLVQQAMDRLLPDVDGYGISKADVIIEAVVEDLGIKQKTFKMIESKAKPSAILATNTSSIPLEDICTVLDMPSRLVGIHFFNPVAKMMLVEVVKGKNTSQEIMENAIGFVGKLDRLPLPVKSSPGFLVNRILMPYLLESVELLNEGIPPQIIDKAMTTFGMPMGPIALADTVGLDVCMSVATFLGKYFNTQIPPKLKQLVEQKKLGRKTGEGFYKYDKNGSIIKTPLPEYTKPLHDISDRLVLRMLNEAFACLNEGVVENGDLLDAGMVYGTGFAPFRGGPIHYAISQGIQQLHQQFILQQQARGEASKQVAKWEIA